MDLRTLLQEEAMLRVKDIVRAIKFRRACGLPPTGDNGSCFGVTDREELRPPFKTTLRDAPPEKEGEK
ncbi:MAG: hypothetical protein KGZ30_03140 [Anaplasmataceae bacterium]|nr:hypothetical protein [Anaplasmataceae bacterium]